MKNVFATVSLFSNLSLGPSEFLASDFLKTCASWTLTHPEHRRVSQSSLARRRESLIADKRHQGNRSVWQMEALPQQGPCPASVK